MLFKLHAVTEILIRCKLHIIYLIYHFEYNLISISFKNNKNKVCMRKIQLEHIHQLESYLMNEDVKFYNSLFIIYIEFF